MNATKQELIQLLYLIARNYHFYSKSGVITFFNDRGINNKKDLINLSEDQLSDLSSSLICIFLTFMGDNKVTPKMQEHYDKYYKPLLDFLKKTYPEHIWI